jgi:O-antigen ligase
MKPSPLPDWPSRCAAAWLLAVVASWPWPGVSEALLSLGACLVAAALLWRRCNPAAPLAGREAWGLCGVVFLAYWLPEFFSAFDALDSARAWREVWLDARYLPYLLAIAIAVDRSRGRRWVGNGLALIAAFWCADALLQAGSGWSLGGAASADRLSGIFGAGNLKLGMVLASLSPFALAAGWRHRGRVGWLVAATAMGLVILLAGARAAWLTYALVLVWSGHRSFGTRVLLIGAAAAVLLVGWAMHTSERLQARFERSAAAIEGDAAGWDDALSGRVSIWRAGLRMAAAYPINGIGVRGFRDAYAQYADGDDFFLSRGMGPALHAHQWLLEVASETGLVGLLLWGLGAWRVWRAWRWVRPFARRRAAVPALALAVSLFPLNTHLALYSNFWGGAVLLLAGLFAGSLMAREGDDDDARSD